MIPRSSVAPFPLAVLLAWLLLLVSAPVRAADDDIELIPAGSEPKAKPAAAPGEIEIRGMHCTPDVKEVETRRPIPVSCTVDYPVAGVELRYRTPGAKKWEKIDLQNSENGYTGTIPCAVTSQRGKLKLYLFARNEKNKVVARIGRNETPLTVNLVDQSSASPPALPGQPPPQRCFEQNECPPELVGTPACPGTRAVKSAKKGWGATCTATAECGTGLECIKEICEAPAKCEEASDCSEGGECIDGKCHVPDAEELKSQLGPAKHHWFGLHAGLDFLMASKATGVCGPDALSADAEKFGCFEGSNEYKGTPNSAHGGEFPGGIYVATVRALLSYDYMVGRLSVGARVGWAFRGAPAHFSPFHIEARVAYSLRKDPFKLSFRPYLGLAVGHAQVDASSTTTIVDCNASVATEQAACVAAKSNADVNTYLADGRASLKEVEAYRNGAPFFFGPTLTMMFALSNEAAIVLTVNAMFPDVTFAPTLGYQMGL